jgi:hypothetical protein
VFGRGGGEEGGGGVEEVSLGLGRGGFGMDGVGGVERG